MDSKTLVIAFCGPLFAYVLTILMTRLGGWQRVCGAYRGEAAKVIHVRHRCSAYFRWIIDMPYRGCLTITVQQNGLSISIFWLFRPMHPPIFIPWQEISEVREKHSFKILKTVELSFNEVPVSIKFYGTAAKPLLDQLRPFVSERLKRE